MTKLFTSLVLLLACALPAYSHEGHGIDGASHYHATDVWGFVILICLMVIVWWFTGRDK